MTVDDSVVSEYSLYLALDEVLAAQRPRSAEHDEMVFIIAHQVHELWFKLALHELAKLQRHLEDGRTAPALETLRRIVRILHVVISPMDVLQTFTPKQFTGFRARLGSGSGSQSAQFREIEAVLGRRDRRIVRTYQAGGRERARIEAAMLRPSVFDSLLRHLAHRGHPIPADRLGRDVTQPLEPSAEIQSVLLDIYHADAAEAQICERLVEVDQAVQEWRYRHVQLVQRVIGAKTGTGGSTGAAYLRTSLFRPMFPDLWEVRNEL